MLNHRNKHFPKPVTQLFREYKYTTAVKLSSFYNILDAILYYHLLCQCEQQKSYWSAHFT